MKLIEAFQREKGAEVQAVPRGKQERKQTHKQKEGKGKKGKKDKPDKKEKHGTVGHESDKKDSKDNPDKDMEKAVAKIQAIQRGKMARKRAGKETETTSAAANNVQDENVKGKKDNEK